MLFAVAGSELDKFVGGVDDALALGVELCFCGIVGILSFVECSTYLFLYSSRKSPTRFIISSASL